MKRKALVVVTTKKALVVATKAVVVLGGLFLVAREIHLIGQFSKPVPQPLPALVAENPHDSVSEYSARQALIELKIKEAVDAAAGKPMNICQGYELALLVCKAQDVAKADHQELKEIHFWDSRQAELTGFEQVKRFRSFAYGVYDCLVPDDTVGDLLQVSKIACGCADAWKESLSAC